MGAFRPQMQAFVNADLYNKPVKNTVEYVIGEIMVTMAIYKSIYKDGKMGEGFTWKFD